MTCAQLKTWLNNRHHIKVPEDWIEACVEWIQEEQGGNLPSSSELQSMVHEQWLHADLREIGGRSLPSGISQDKFQLSGIYTLQIDWIRDVSTSYYSQLQTVKGVNTSNINVTANTQVNKNESGNKMMMLQLTDGQTEVKAMEYSPISILHHPIQPGCKVCIQGSIKCRNGVLMLKRDNIKILGGEVETLVDVNTPDNILQMALEEKKGMARPDNRRYEGDRSNVGRKPKTESKPAVYKPKAEPERTVSRPKVEQRDDFEDDFMDHMDADQLDAMQEEWDAEMAEERRNMPCPPSPQFDENRPLSTTVKSETVFSVTQNDSHSARPSLSQNKPIKTERSQTVTRTSVDPIRTSSVVKIEPDPFTMPSQTKTKETQMSMKNFMVPSASTSGVSELNSNKKRTSDEILPVAKRNCMDEDFPSVDDSNFDLDDDLLCEHVENSQEQIKSMMVNTPLPFTYISRALKAGQKIFKIRAYISTLVTKLQVNGGAGWSLIAKINDGSAAMDVEFGDQKMKVEAKQSQQIRTKLEKAIHGCQRCLIELLCVMSVDASTQVPKITQLHTDIP